MLNTWTRAEHVAYVQGCLIATGEGWEDHCQYAYHQAQLAYYRQYLPEIVVEAERTLAPWLEV